MTVDGIGSLSGCHTGKAIVLQVIRKLTLKPFHAILQMKMTCFLNRSNAPLDKDI
jgi:hypothetical protein